MKKIEELKPSERYDKMVRLSQEIKVNLIVMKELSMGGSYYTDSLDAMKFINNNVYQEAAKDNAIETDCEYYESANQSNT